MSSRIGEHSCCSAANGELHLPLDARPSRATRKSSRRLDRVLEQRRLADAGLSVHHEDGAVAAPRGLQQPVEHLALALPAEQPPRLRADDHLGSMPPGCTDYGFPGFDRTGGSGQLTCIESKPRRGS